MKAALASSIKSISQRAVSDNLPISLRHNEIESTTDDLALGDYLISRIDSERLRLNKENPLLRIA
jgi:ERCC4-type nuclease